APVAAVSSFNPDACRRSASNPGAFGNEECDPVWLLLCVSATDANAHILTIQRISQVIDSPQRLAAVGNASTDDALFALVSG
ncbi:PTS sugar transporter subunit IIA, partial [Pseudomonas aeruginosa]|uniref:PTS sugar transporter subunit IIA n=1 Tax=Pseudomonas aeruginosa TaxID=287 RepID=UPI0031B74AB4